MKLVLKNTLGESISLQIRPEDTFIDLKERVEDEAGISLAISNIAQNGKFQETQRVFEYFVSQNPEYDEDAVLEGPISDGDLDVECAVPGCVNTKQSRPDKVFFDFPQLPQDEIRCHQWVLYCQRLSMASGKHRLNLSQESSICADHFKPDQFVKNTTTLLKRTAVPCINPELPSVGCMKNFGPRPRSPIDTQDDSLLPIEGEHSFICRLCAGVCNDPVFIYGGEGRRLLLPEKINACLPIKVKMTDNLPKQVCKECLDELNSLKNFAQLCLDSNLSLTKSHFKSNGICGSCPLCTEGNISKCEEIPEEDDDLVCKICNEMFEDAEEFSKHSHDEVYFHCNECENYYNTFEDLDEHVITSHRNDDEDEDEEITCDRCGTSFESQAILDEHICDNLAISNKCHVCHKVFRSNSRLEFHLKFHYGAKVGFCELCRKHFTDEVKLYKHTMYRHNVDKSFQCYECDKVFRSASSLKYHRRNHGDQDLRPFTCEWCGKCFIRKTMLTNHITSTHKNMAQVSTCFSCKVCSEAFPSTNVAVAHMDSKHKEDCIDESTYSFEMHTVNKVYVCEYCDRCYVEAQTLNKHREAHVSEIPYECKYCMFTFSSGGELNEHKMTHSEEELPLEYTTNFQVPLTYLCEYCDRCFVNYVKFTEHLTIHFKPEPYQCRTCNAHFKTLEEVTEHKLDHPLEEPSFDLNSYRPYECHYCTKAFAIEDALVKHIRMHTGEKPFICLQCGKGFSQSSGLYTHMKVHSSIRPYSCSICPRTFKIKGDRDVHVRKHSGDRPYKCEYCQKAFMTQHVYSQHRKIHTGERPYKCDVCGIAFRRSHVLTVHKRIHTGEKPNICDICGKRYRQKGDMLKHRRIQHGLLKSNPNEDLKEIFNI